jgi:hypothetical protein
MRVSCTGGLSHAHTDTNPRFRGGSFLCRITEAYARGIARDFAVAVSDDFSAGIPNRFANCFTLSDTQSSTHI